LDLVKRDKTKPLFIRIRRPLPSPTFDRSLYKIKPPEYEAPAHIQDIFDFWYSLNLKKLPSKTSVSYKNAIQSVEKILKGEFFTGKIADYPEWANHKFPKEDMFLSIERFAISTNDPDYYPVDKSYHKSITLNYFLYNPYSKFQKSLFIYYLQNEPTLRVMDNNPTLTSYLITIYKKEVTSETVTDLSSNNKDKFIQASSQLKTFFIKNVSRLRMGISITEMKMARWLYEAILADVKDAYKIKPGFFCSKETFEVRLPLYLNSQGVLK
jgi:hypothetical protein